MGSELVPVPKRSVDVRKRAWGIQCTARRHDGEPCQRWAIRGGNVCHKHGGQLPVVRAAANARLRTLAESAVREIARLVESPDVDDAVKLRAIKLVLRLNHISDALPERKQGRQAAGHRAIEAGAQRALQAGGGELDSAIEELLAQVTTPDEVDE